MADTIQIGGTCSFNVTISRVPCPEPSQAGVFITTVCDGITTKGRAPMAYNLPDDHMIQVQISYVDAKGNPASIDGMVAWSSADTTIATVSADTTDSTKATITPAAKLGQTQITATADADLGPGVSTILTPFDVTVVAGAAVAGTITPVGDPIPMTASKTSKK